MYTYVYLYMCMYICIYIYMYIVTSVCANSSSGGGALRCCAPPYLSRMVFDFFSLSASFFSRKIWHKRECDIWGETEEMVFLAVFWEFFELNLRHMAEVGVRHLGRDGRNEFFGF